MPCDAVADDRQRQVEVRRRLDEPDAAAQVADRRRPSSRSGSLGLWIRLKPYGRSPRLRLQAVDGGLDARRATARRRRRSRACRPGSSPRRSRPSRCRWPSPRRRRRSAGRGRPESPDRRGLRAGRPAQKRSARTVLGEPVALRAQLQWPADGAERVESGLGIKHREFTADKRHEPECRDRIDDSRCCSPTPAPATRTYAVQ